MLSRKGFWSTTLALGACGLAAGYLLSHFFHPLDVSTKAIWKDVYRSPAEMRQDVDAIVVGRVLGIEPGRVATSEKGEHALQFELVELQAVSALKGASAGEHLFVERLAQTELGEILLDGDGGPFEVGKTYWLFLKQQPGSHSFYQVNNQGRYLISRGRLHAADPDDPVAVLFEGKTLSEGLSLLQRASSGRSPSV